MPYMSRHRIGRPPMTYSPGIEHSMRIFHDSLSEKGRRRYAAIEAAKLGHGGLQYIAALLGCDPKTIRQGQADLDHPPDGLDDRARQKATVFRVKTRRPVRARDPELTVIGPAPSPGPRGGPS